MLESLFSEPARSLPLTPSPAPDAHDHPDHDDAVSNTAHEMDQIEPIHAEDGDDGSDEDLSDDSAADFPLFNADSDDADEASNFDRQGVVPTGSNALETALLSKLDEDKAQDIVLIDAGDVIVHLFRPEVRMFYNIEKIWAVDSAHRTANA